MIDELRVTSYESFTFELLAFPLSFKPLQGFISIRHSILPGLPPGANNPAVLNPSGIFIQMAMIIELRVLNDEFRIMNDELGELQSFHLSALSF